MVTLKRLLKKLPGKKLVASITLFGFVFLAFVPYAFADYRFDSNAQEKTTQEVKPTNSTKPNNTAKPINPNGVKSATTSGKVQVQLPSGEVEEGEVLFCVPFLTCGGGIADSIASAIKWIFEQLLGFTGDIIDFLIVLVGKVILYAVHIVAMPFGTNAGDPDGMNDTTCEENLTGAEQEACKDLVLQIQVIDPLFKPEVGGFASKVNLFTIADGTFSGLYGNFNGIRTPQHLAYEFKDNILGIRPAQAQGLGTASIGGLMREVWEKMRDIAYIAMVLVLVVVGFMIMFRKKLDPRTAVTAANSLPRIVISLILITFSFAISGLFIDFIFISVEIIRNYLGTIGGLAGPLSNAAEIGGHDVGEFVWLPFFTLISSSILNWGGFLLMMVSGVGLSVAFFTGPLAVLVILGAVLAAVALDLFIRVILFVLAILLFWALLKRFVMMLLLTVFSPFFFLMGAIPGFESVTVNWAKRMLASALAFPAILVIVYIAVALLSADFGTILGEIPGVPGGEGAPTPPPPLKGAAIFLNLSTLAGLGVLFYASKVPDSIDEMLRVRESSGIKGFGPGTAAGGITGASVSGGRAMQTFQRIGASNLPIVRGIGRFFGRAPGGGAGGGAGAAPGSSSRGYTRRESTADAVGAVRSRFQERDRAVRRGSASTNTPNANANTPDNNPPDEDRAPGGGPGGTPT